MPDRGNFMECQQWMARLSVLNYAWQIWCVIFAVVEEDFAVRRRKWRVNIRNMTAPFLR